MLIKMTTSRFASPDGDDISFYYKDRVYDVAENFGKNMIKKGFAKSSSKQEQLLVEQFKNKEIKKAAREVLDIISTYRDYI